MGNRKLTRRGVLAALAGGGILAGVAQGALDHRDPDSLGAGGQPGVLAIGPTETYQIPGGETESYAAVNWADGGELNLDGELTLADQA